MQYSTILGIESSCDDTAAAIWQNGKILANITAGQAVHEQFGGVVPELASRAHQSNIIPVIEIALKKAGIDGKSIDAIAFTRGPGLTGSLLVGINAAKGLAMGWNKPMIGVHHLQAHVSALFIDNPNPQFPVLCLLVSGGHTQLLLVKNYMDMEIIGSTLDDAAGEAFDKGAKLLGLPYPGGPHIDKLSKLGNPKRFHFQAGRVAELDFSFSGIKTSLLYFIRDNKEENPNFISENLQDICAGYQNSIIEYLISKTEKAIQQHKPASIGLAGGVSANSGLRTAFENLSEKHDINAIVPAFEYCTDNAAMIAAAGHYLLESGESTSFNALPFARG